MVVSYKVLYVKVCPAPDSVFHCDRGVPPSKGKGDARASNVAVAATAAVSVFASAYV